MRYLLLGLSISSTSLLVACGASHAPEMEAPRDAGAPPRTDASSSEDGGPETPDTSVPLPRVVSCRGEATGVTAGGPCFCQGPFVRSGTLVYRASYELEVIDVSDPAAPALVVTVPLGRPSSDGAVTIVGDTLVVAGFGVELFSLADPAAPVSLGTVAIDEPADTRGAAALGRFALVTVARGFREAGAIVAIDVAERRVSGSIAIAGEPGAVVAAGGLAYAGMREGSADDERDSVVVVEVSDAGAVTSRGTVAVSSRALLGPELASQGAALWVAGGSGRVTTPLVEALDLASPTAPVHAGAVDGDEVVLGVAAAADLVFSLGSRIRIVDAADPRSPRIAGTIDGATIGDVHFGDLDGDYLLVSGGNALTSIRVECDRE